MEKATRLLGEGNLDIEVKIISNDEFQNLGDSFNYMVKNLKEKTHSLEKAKDTLSRLLSDRERIAEELHDTNDELKKTNEQLKKANRMQSEFVTNMSHELRTPLNAIINFTDQIIEDWQDLRTDEEWNKEAREMMERVMRSSMHLLSLINDLLDLAKIESGQATLQISSCNLEQLLNDTLAEVSPHPGKRNCLEKRVFRRTAGFSY